MLALTAVNWSSFFGSPSSGLPVGVRVRVREPGSAWLLNKGVLGLCRWLPRLRASARAADGWRWSGCWRSLPPRCHPSRTNDHVTPSPRGGEAASAALSSKSGSSTTQIPPFSPPERVDRLCRSPLLHPSFHPSPPPPASNPSPGSVASKNQLQALKTSLSSH